MYPILTAALLLAPSADAAALDDISADRVAPPTAGAPLLAQGMRRPGPLDGISQTAGSTAPTASSSAARSRGFDMEAGLRWRSLSIPRSILSARFTEASDDGWPLPEEDRPNVRGMAYGPEFIMKWDVSNVILYMEHLDLSWDGGYWDDRDEDFEDGSYLIPTKNLGMYAFGADYAAEIHLVRTANTNEWFGWSILLGAGLGIGFVTGQVEYWEATEDSNLQGYEKYALGEPPSDTAKIPRVLPMVDINASMRFNIHDRVALRFEGGLHDVLYWGFATGVLF